MSDKGFSIIEIVVVLSILLILATIAGQYYLGLVENAKAEVCNTNCIQLGRLYDAYLILEKKTHSDLVFDYFLQEYEFQICPEGGQIIYQQANVRCSIHGAIKDDTGGGVPFL